MPEILVRNCDQRGHQVGIEDKFSSLALGDDRTENNIFYGFRIHMVLCILAIVKCTPMPHKHRMNDISYSMENCAYQMRPIWK